jgi:HTH-type transcriptional regulator / antitoxin HigA
VTLEDQDFKTPGQLIQHLLDYRGWTQRVLAVVLGIDETGLNKIVAGKRPVDASLAISLGVVLDVPPERLLELQRTYDLALARLTSRPDPNLVLRARLFGELPVPEMIKRGWLPGVSDIRNVSDVESGLCKFFGVASVEEIEAIPHAAKKTDEASPVSPSQVAWLYRVKQIAADMLVARFTKNSVDDAISKMQYLLGDPDSARKVPRILAEAGIRFVIVESLPSAKIDGVCFWIDDESPVVGMSLRYDRIDNFWFVLRHELEHVKRGHGRHAAMFDAELEGDKAGTGSNIPEEERVANDAAANFCVDQVELKRFISKKSPFFAERDIVGFARTLKIHPGLVAGQLQRYTSRYDRFRTHLAKIRSSVKPGAMVDGWGDVAPLES